MPGPEPNPNRRRRNVPVKEAERVVLPTSGRKGRAPAPRTDMALSVAGKDQWKAWWSSPMATQWRIEDAYPLTRLLLLYEQEREAGPHKDRSAEMRQLEGRFGLDPRSRRELKWVIGDVDDETGQEPPKLASVTSADDARRARVAAKAAGAG